MSGTAELSSDRPIGAFLVLMICRQRTVNNPQEREIMTESEAKRRAMLVYRKRRTKSMTLMFYPSDMEPLGSLEGLSEPKATYIK